MGYVVRLMHYETYKGYVEFNVWVQNGGEGVWHFRRRYSVMRDWHEKLKRDVRTLPEFPEKKWCGRFDLDFLAERERSLESYFSELTQLPHITQLSLFQSFIQPPDSVFLVNPLGRLNHSFETAKSIFKSTESACKLIVEQTSGAFVDMGDLPSPMDDSDTKRREKEVKRLLDREKLSLSWKAPDPKLLPLSHKTYKRPHSHLLWFHSCVGGLQDALEACTVNEVRIITQM